MEDLRKEGRLLTSEVKVPKTFLDSNRAIQKYEKILITYMLTSEVRIIGKKFRMALKETSAGIQVFSPSSFLVIQKWNHLALQRQPAATCALM